MAELAQKPMTLTEFLTWDDGTDTRYELVFGQARAMAPPGDAHGTIAANLTVRLGPGLRPPCRVVSEAGIVLPGRADTYFVADLAATCAPPERGRIYLTDPVLVVEVLSPSTMAHDRGLKLTHYRRVPSIQEILLAATDERRVELWRRRGEQWVVEDLIGDAVFRLDSVEVKLAMADIYQAVAL